MSTGMMSKKHKHKQEVKPNEVPKPRVTSFVARDCTACTALRESDASAKGKSFSRVYATSGAIRYCRCGYCNNTWKQTE